MKFIDHPLALTAVFVCGSIGVAVAVWVFVSGYVAGEPFSWELLLLALFWLWGAFSSGKRLLKRKNPVADAADQ